MVTLITQVFVLQGVHHAFSHHDHGSPCDIEGVHMHSSEHAHFSCDICLFQFAPTELLETELSINEYQSFPERLQFSSQTYHFTQEYLQTYLRGPPSFLA